MCDTRQRRCVPYSCCRTASATVVSRIRIKRHCLRPLGIESCIIRNTESASGCGVCSCTIICRVPSSEGIIGLCQRTLCSGGNRCIVSIVSSVCGHSTCCTRLIISIVRHVICTCRTNNLKERDLSSIRTTCPYFQFSCTNQSIRDGLLIICRCGKSNCACSAITRFCYVHRLCSNSRFNLITTLKRTI